MMSFSIDQLSQNLPHELNREIFEAWPYPVPEKFYGVEIDPNRTIQDVLIERGELEWEPTPYQSFLQILEGKTPNVSINTLARFFTTTEHLKPLREYLSRIYVSDDELWEFPIFAHLTDLIDEWSDVFDPQVDETNVNAFLWYSPSLLCEFVDVDCVSDGMDLFLLKRVGDAPYQKFLAIVRGGMVRRWIRNHTPEICVILELSRKYYEPPDEIFRLGGGGYQDAMDSFHQIKN